MIPKFQILKMILLCRHQNGHCGGRTVTGETKKDAETRTRDYNCHPGSSLGLNSRKTSTFAELETSPVSWNSHSYCQQAS